MRSGAKQRPPAYSYSHQAPANKSIVCFAVNPYGSIHMHVHACESQNLYNMLSVIWPPWSEQRIHMRGAISRCWAGLDLISRTADILEGFKFGVDGHTFRVVNKEGKETYVEFHRKPTCSTMVVDVLLLKAIQKDARSHVGNVGNLWILGPYPCTYTNASCKALLTYPQ